MTARQRAAEREQIRAEIKQEEATNASAGRKSAALRAHHTMKLAKFDEQTRIATEALKTFGKASPKVIAAFEASRVALRSQIQ